MSPTSSWPLCVIDTETTGLPSDPSARVVEIGAVIVGRDGRRIGTFQQLVRTPLPPQEHWSDGMREAMAVHGIEPSALEAGTEPAQVMMRWRVWLQAFPFLPRITAWRTTFDETMLERSAMPLFRTAPKTRCIHDVAREVLGHLGDEERGPSLRKAAQALGVALPAERHRAVPDALLAAQVAVALEGRHPRNAFVSLQTERERARRLVARGER